MVELDSFVEVLSWFRIRRAAVAVDDQQELVSSPAPMFVFTGI